MVINKTTRSNAFSLRRSLPKYLRVKFVSATYMHGRIGERGKELGVGEHNNCNY